MFSRLHRAGRQLEMSDYLNVEVIVSQATEEQLRSMIDSARGVTEQDSKTVNALKIKDKRVRYQAV